MGMCAVRGPLVTNSPGEEVEDIMEYGDVATPRSTASDISSSSSSSQSLDDESAAADHYDQAGEALWQRPIPKGRRCRALSLSGVILFDPTKHLKLET